MEIGELIRERRLAKKLTQKRLGEMLGYTGRSAEAVVQNWEYGKQPVPQNKLKPMSKVLEVPLEDLLP